MAKYSLGYERNDVEAVRGGAGAFRVLALVTKSPRVLRDMTGQTVRFRAVGGAHVIEKTITTFVSVEGVACGIDIALSEDDTRPIDYDMDWEMDDSDRVVFAGGKLTATGGANLDA